MKNKFDIIDYYEYNKIFKEIFNMVTTIETEVDGNKVGVRVSNLVIRFKFNSYNVYSFDSDVYIIPDDNDICLFDTNKLVQLNNAIILWKTITHILKNTVTETLESLLDLESNELFQWWKNRNDIKHIIYE